MIDEKNVIDSFTGDYFFLSNFYLVDVILEGRTYPSVEHAYQAAKTRDPLDPARELIAQMAYPRDAKKLGRQVLLRPNWDAYRKHFIMTQLVTQKFTYSPEMSAKLLATGDSLLIEGNTWHDNAWGDCRCGRVLCSGQGHNLLGVTLMRLREDL